MGSSIEVCYICVERRKSWNGYNCVQSIIRVSTRAGDVRCIN